LQVEDTVLANYQAAFDKLPSLESQVEALQHKLDLESARAAKGEALLNKV
jgi:hypothetical protein